MWRMKLLCFSNISSSFWGLESIGKSVGNEVYMVNFSKDMGF